MRMVHVLIAGAVVLSLFGCKGGGTIHPPVAGAPHITAVAPLTAVAAASVTFSATNTGGAVVTWAWSFGGGASPNTSSAAAPAVTAGSVGSYNGSVTATNATGSSAFPFTFTVTVKGGGGSGKLGELGGTITLGSVTITAPQHTLIGAVNFMHTTTAVPAGLPSGFNPAAGQADEIDVDHGERLNAPMIITFSYSDAGMTNENSLLVLHYTTATGYEPTTVLSIDTTANKVTIDSRAFSIFVIGTPSQAASASAVGFDVGFTPGNNGWQIDNFTTNFAPNGNCLGMSGYAMWYFNNRAGNLYGKFDDSGDPSIVQLLITRAHLAQSQYWAQKDFNYQQTLSASLVGTMMESFMSLFHTPLILIMSSGPSSHACVVHGWDATGFNFYDVNLHGADQHVNWSSASGFGTYLTYDHFGFVAQPSMGRTEDFETLTQEAEAGFTTANTISVSAPTPDQHIVERSTKLQGSITGTVASPMQMLAYVKGIMQEVALDNSSAFDATIPVSYGDNTVVLLAAVNITQQSNFYQNAATKIFNIVGETPRTELLATLTWDQGDTDVDLYCTEPEGESVWYMNKMTSNKLSLDFDNTTGFGPEHVTLSTDTGGIMLDGIYKIRVHYYSDHQTDHSGGYIPVTGNVSVVIFEDTTLQKMITVPFALNVSNEGNDQPGSTGPDWVDIATVDLGNQKINGH